MELVTVIIPAHNYGRYISDTLESVLKQTYTNWECLIVDDGSTDNTQTEVNKYVALDARFRYIYQVCQGVSAARNEGIRQARGQYVQYLDADDILLGRKLELQVSYLEKYPAVDIVYSESRYFANDDQSKLSHSMDMQDVEWMPKVDAVLGSALFYLSKGNITPIQAPLSRMSLLKKAGEFDKSMRHYEDWDYWFRCVAAGGEIRFLNAPEAISLIRVHKASASNNSEAMRKSWSVMNDRILSYIKNNDTIINKIVMNDIVKGEAVDLIKSKHYTKGFSLYLTTIGKPTSGKTTYRDIVYWLKMNLLGARS